MILAATPGTAALLLELGAVLIALAVLGRVAARLGVPSIPLYLIAGLAVGEGGVVELVTARTFVESGAQIGVILLLLLLGLEYTGEELTSALRHHAGAGAVDLVLNFTPGLMLGLVLDWDFRAALLLGGITYISSSGIIAKVLSDLGNTGNRETPVVLAILVTEDLVMALYLPLMAGLLIGGDAFDIALEVSIAIAAVATALVVAIRYGSRISAIVFDRSDENLLLTLLGVAAPRRWCCREPPSFRCSRSVSRRDRTRWPDRARGSTDPRSTTRLVRGHVLRVLRAPDQPGGPSSSPRVGDRPRSGHCVHKAGDRMVERRSGWH